MSVVHTAVDVGSPAFRGYLQAHKSKWQIFRTIRVSNTLVEVEIVHTDFHHIEINKKYIEINKKHQISVPRETDAKAGICTHDNWREKGCDNHVPAHLTRTPKRKLCTFAVTWAHGKEAAAIPVGGFPRINYHLFSLF